MSKKVALPVAKKSNETDAAYMKRLMKSLYGRDCDPMAPVGKDGFQRKVKSSKIGG